MKLKSIYIKGFKDPEREINLEFSDEPITVIYGVNGSGKTTLLRILTAVLDRNEAVLLKENVHKIIIDYENGQKYKLIVTREKSFKFHWEDKNGLCNSAYSDFGVNRGLVEGTITEGDFERIFGKILDKGFYEYSRNRKYNNINDFDYEYEIEEIRDQINTQMNEYFTSTKQQKLSLILGASAYDTNNIFKLLMGKENYEKSFNANVPNISADVLSISDLEKAIIRRYREGEKLMLKKAKNAFLETLENAFLSQKNGYDVVLEDNFEVKLDNQVDFVEKLLMEEEDTTIIRRLKEYMQTRDNSILNENNILKILLINILEKAEEPNPELKSIEKLIKIFNDHLFYDKKLIVTSESAFIELQNGNKHSLSELSSGERHLLTFLTLFLIIGNDRNFFFIDEPEISLNLKWQEKLLSLLSELSPNAQIIVATHSPAIASRNTNYLKELV